MAVDDPPLALVLSVIADQVTCSTESEVDAPLAGAATASGTVSAKTPLTFGSDNTLKPLVFWI
jgi:hypothetical protein